MRALRLFRSNTLPEKHQTARITPDESGLLAFASETRVPAPGPAAPNIPTTAPGGTRVQPMVAVLAALVLLEAVPAVLWVKGQFGAPSVTALASTIPPAPVVAAAAPCDGATPTATAGSSGPLGQGAGVAAAGKLAAVAAPVAAAPASPALVAGMLAVSAPVPMHVYARGKLVGTTEAPSIMLPVGTHDLLLENADVGFRVRRMVTVQAGRTSSITLEAPGGTLHVNAVPWADVWVDNRRAGETPIGNLQVPIGTREVVFRHPELGERKTTVLVTLKGPNRVSMDMRTK